LRKKYIALCTIANMVLITMLINQYTLIGEIKYLIIPISAILSFLSPPAGLALVISSSTALGGITMNYPGSFLQALVGASVLFSILLKRILEKDLFNSSIHIEDYVLVLLIMIIGIMGLGKVDFNQLQDYIANLFLKKYSNENSFWGLVFTSRWIYFIFFGALAIRSSKELLYLIYFLILGGVYQILAIPLHFYSDLFVTICLMGDSSEGLQLFNTNRAEIGYYFALTTALSFLLFKTKKLNPKLAIVIIFTNFLLLVISSSKGPLLSTLIFMPVAIYLMRTELKKCIAAILFVVVIFCGIFPVCNYGTFLTANYINTFAGSINSRLSLYNGGLAIIEENSLSSATGRKLTSTDVEAVFRIQNNTSSGFDEYKMTGTGSGTHNLFFDIYINNGFLLSASFLLLFVSIMVILFVNIKNKDDESKVINYFYITLAFIVGAKLFFSTATHVSMWPGVILGITFGLTKYYRNKQ
jgi:O-antigen ligase